MKAETKANTQQKQSTREPVAVCISDIHFNIQTLSLASAALLQAVNTANSLGIDLVIAGDLHDQKAHLRGECVKAILDILEECKNPPIVLVANHDRINEKSPAHSLEFLRHIASIVAYPVKLNRIGCYLIPYYHDPEELKAHLKTVPKGSRLIMHQGVQKSNAGHYIQDKSALPAECFADFRVISGHYHTRQDIKCGRPQRGHVGLFSYIGNPYTLNYAEASDPEKGFRVLYSDGSLEFVPTHLRTHQVIERRADALSEGGHVTYKTTEDLIWVKVTGTQDQINRLSKETIARDLGLITSFRLELIPTDKIQVSNTLPNLTNSGLFDNIIDSLEHTEADRKTRLKAMWRNLVPNRGGL